MWRAKQQNHKNFFLVFITCSFWWIHFHYMPFLEGHIFTTVVYTQLCMIIFHEYSLFSYQYYLSNYFHHNSILWWYYFGALLAYPCTMDQKMAKKTQFAGIFIAFFCRNITWVLFAYIMVWRRRWLHGKGWYHLN